ncbi:MAG: diacylglycerol kinase family lipid kinase [Myxococcales bacterium]|jgi:diacylglycerol kinase (ATP)|nr:diacylglycerol kinase family lipid kinase [Myxococcales bacterium]
MRAVRTTVIVNPSAASGRAGRLEGQIREDLESAGISYVWAPTEGPRHATELARRAVEDQVDTILTVGGDGTLNEVIHGYLDETGRPRRGPALCVLPVGTGGDFRKTFDWEDGVAAGLERLRRGRKRPLDLGLVELTRLDGSLERRAFVNILSFGVGGVTDQLVNAGPKWIGGKAAFFLGALRATFAYRPVPVEVLVDGDAWLTSPILNVALANGRFFGGGMHIAPEADPSDGWLDLVAITDRNAVQSLGLAPYLYRGTHMNQAGVHGRRGRRVEARPTRPDAEVLIDLDGEMPGKLPLTAELAPGAIDLLV